MRYYVSNSGRDTDTGTAPSEAWRTIAKVNSFAFAPGDVVQFECGGEWRGQLVPHSGSDKGHVTYTSYGEGRKPLFLGSVEENDPGDWEQVETNLWRTGPLPHAVGNIIFNDGQTCGIKVWNGADVNEPNRFWYDHERKTVLLHASQNPSTLFDDIECALTRHIIPQEGKSYVIYDGLHLAYGAAHGIGGGDTHHIIVRNCDLCFIGGGHRVGSRVQHSRYGNGVEFWRNAHDNLVENCRIWEIYDAGLTNQGAAQNSQYNITYRNNLIWNCEYSFEYFNRLAESTTRDIYFEDNLCFNAGEGWSHAQRPWPAGVHLKLGRNPAQTDKFFVRRNVFHLAKNSAINIKVSDWNSVDGLRLGNNTYVQSADEILVRWGDESFTAGAFAEYQDSTKKDTDSRIATFRGVTLKPVKPVQNVLRVGQFQQTTATATYSSDTSIEVTRAASFASSDDSVAAIDAHGRVRAVGPGKATITATFAGMAATVSVVVSP